MKNGTNFDDLFSQLLLSLPIRQELLVKPITVNVNQILAQTGIRSLNL